MPGVSDSSHTGGRLGFYWARRRGWQRVRSRDETAGTGWLPPSDRGQCCVAGLGGLCNHTGDACLHRLPWHANELAFSLPVCFFHSSSLSFLAVLFVNFGTEPDLCRPLRILASILSAPKSQSIRLRTRATDSGTGISQGNRKAFLHPVDPSSVLVYDLPFLQAGPQSTTETPRPPLSMSWDQYFARQQAGLAPPAALRSQLDDLAKTALAPEKAIFHVLDIDKGAHTQEWDHIWLLANNLDSVQTDVVETDNDLDRVLEASPSAGVRIMSVTPTLLQRPLTLAAPSRRQGPSCRCG